MCCKLGRMIGTSQFTSGFTFYKASVLQRAIKSFNISLCSGISIIIDANDNHVPEKCSLEKPTKTNKYTF